MTPWRRTLSNEDLFFVDDLVWNYILGGLECGSLQLGVCNARATDSGLENHVQLQTQYNIHNILVVNVRCDVFARQCALDTPTDCSAARCAPRLCCAAQIQSPHYASICCQSTYLSFHVSFDYGTKRNGRQSSKTL